MANTDKELKNETATAIYGPQHLDRVNQSAAALDAINAQRPADYTSKYQVAIDKAMDAVLNREPFHYDVNADSLYKQLNEQYTRGGKQAMTDAMGQAAALTGGYGSSYGQRVGQQTYDNYMQGMTDRIPELYQLALDRYDRQGADAKDRLSLLQGAENQDYSRYNDRLALWLSDRDYLAGRYDTNLSQAMATGDALYSRLASLIPLGYVPTAEELAAAGMTENQYRAIAGQLLPNGGGGDDGGSRRRREDSPYTLTDWAQDAAAASQGNNAYQNAVASINAATNAGLISKKEAANYNWLKGKG